MGASEYLVYNMAPDRLFVLTNQTYVLDSGETLELNSTGPTATSHWYAIKKQDVLNGWGDASHEQLNGGVSLKGKNGYSNSVGIFMFSRRQSNGNCYLALFCDSGTNLYGGIYRGILDLTTFPSTKLLAISELTGAPSATEEWRFTVETLANGNIGLRLEKDVSGVWTTKYWYEDESVNKITSKGTWGFGFRAYINTTYKSYMDKVRFWR